MDSVTLDPVDLRLLHALQIDGRAAFSRIADVLGVSDRTVARRFDRLRARGSVRVAGVTGSRHTGHAEWLVHLRVLPSGAAALTRALTRRPDTAWVTVTSSGTGIVCVFRVPGEGPAPLDALGRLPQVTHADAQRLLRPVMDRRWSGRTSALTEEETAALRPAAPTETAAFRLTDLDRRLLPALAVDGRAACPDLARLAGWSESAVRRRLDELRRSGVLRFDVEVDSGLFGCSAHCLLRLSVAPARLGEVSRALSGDREAAFVATTTGPHNLMAVAVCQDAGALHTYLMDRIGALPGVAHVETAMITSYAKRAAPVPMDR